MTTSDCGLPDEHGQRDELEGDHRGRLLRIWPEIEDRRHGEHCRERVPALDGIPGPHAPFGVGRGDRQREDAGDAGIDREHRTREHKTSRKGERGAGSFHRARHEERRGIADEGPREQRRAHQQHRGRLAPRWRPVAEREHDANQGKRQQDDRRARLEAPAVEPLAGGEPGAGEDERLARYHRALPRFLDLSQ